MSFATLIANPQFVALTTFGTILDNQKVGG
jgi:hypothetical protein